MRDHWITHHRGGLLVLNTLLATVVGCRDRLLRDQAVFIEELVAHEVQRLLVLSPLRPGCGRLAPSARS